MFYDTSVALRPNAERISAFAISLLASVDEGQQLEIVTRLDEFFDRLAESLGYKRSLVRIGSICSRYLWMPVEGASNGIRTDIEVFYQPDILNQPTYFTLTKLLSRNRPEVAHRLIVCAVVTRDWHLGDFESIQQADNLINQIQLDVADEAARRRAGQRFGGRKKSVNN